MRRFLSGSGPGSLTKPPDQLNLILIPNKSWNYRISRKIAQESEENRKTRAVL